MLFDYLLKAIAPLLQFGKGGGGGGDTTVMQKWEPPPWTVPLWTDYGTKASEIGSDWTNNPQNYVYTGQGLDPYTQGITNYGRLAPMNEQQFAGIGGISSTAASPIWNQAYQHAYNTLGGDYAQHAEYNPFGGYTNPYLEDMIAQSNADITKGYGEGTAAQLDQMAAQSGAFGGGAYEMAKQNNQRSLGDTLARNVTGIRQNQYTNAANLEQQRIATENANYEAERQRQMQTMGLIPGLATGQLGAYQAQMQAGTQQQDQYQKYLDSLRSMWNEQLQAPLIGLDISGSALQRASGGQGQSITQTLGPAYSPVQGGLAALLGASGLYSLFK